MTSFIPIFFSNSINDCSIAFANLELFGTIQPVLSTINAASPTFVTIHGVPQP